ncbi:hypothetical protein [Neorhizobium petrolearium]|uniref:hypothetical protein n=1 Tax=Neorhizobium petrolearium TaxID=515361 RepID=UPI003F141A88
MTLRPWQGRHAREFAAITSRLENCADSEVPIEIIAYLDGQPVAFECEVANQNERAFVVMCALDDAVMRIHPSIKTRHSGRGSSIGSMMSIMRSERTMTGAYAEVPGKGFVLPKGLLMPGKPRTKGYEESGTSLSHQFSFLSFVPVPAKNFTLRPLALPPSRLSVSEDAIGKVGLAPIAVDRDDLEFRASDRNHRAFLDTFPEDGALNGRIESGVSALLDKGAGLIVLPELVTNAAAVEALQESLRKSGRDHNAMVLVGSGPSKETSTDIGRPFNEAVIMTGTGEELFRQRKLNAFNIRA